jgi:cytochrome c oxidase cbb3-type subunit III
MDSFLRTLARNIALVAVCLAAPLGVTMSQQTKGPGSRPPADRKAREQAKATFESVCAACHGLDGHGGERGPDLVSRPEVVRKSDTELKGILQNGVATAGMPAFASYGAVRLSSLVAYLRELQGGGQVASLPGSPAQGKTLFFGRAKCSECHSLAGQGGFFAQDLTAFGAGMSAGDVRIAIVRPNQDLDPRRGLITVNLSDSATLTGVARSEDNFSIQLQTQDGTFHMLNKSDIRGLTYTGQSAMPSDYEKTLSSGELNDLVSFLMETSRSVKRNPTKRPYGFDGDENNENNAQ